MNIFPNPYRPGAGHAPPYLAGRDREKEEFVGLLNQTPIITNVILTGLRGVGKTVLLEALKPIAFAENWFWCGTDLSESASVSEDRLVERILADLTPITASIVIAKREQKAYGFTQLTTSKDIHLDYDFLKYIYTSTPGLTADRLRRVIEIVWEHLKTSKRKGIVFAYDEAQVLSDQKDNREFPLSVLLEVFQSLQRKGLPVLLILTGLPTIFPKLVEARTYSERMFHVMTISQLNDDESRKAIEMPLREDRCPVTFTALGVTEVIKQSGGYPYFIQFICREFFDLYIQRLQAQDEDPAIRVVDTIRKLDADFFSARWERLTERQQELLILVSGLPGCDTEFAVHDIVKSSQNTASPFSQSNVNQQLTRLINLGMVFRNRHGKYSFAVPMLSAFIRRQNATV